MIKLYLRLVMVWLGFGLGLAVVVLLLFGRTLDAELVRDPVYLHALVVKAGLAWLGFGLAFAALSYAAGRTRAHEWVISGLGTVVNTILLLGLLACMAKVMFMVVPEFSTLRPAILLDRVLAPVWAVTWGAGSHVGIPTTMAGVPSGPLLLFGLLLFGRIAANWGIQEMTPRAQLTAPIPVTRGDAVREVDPEAEKRRQAALRRVAVASYTEAKALLTTTEIPLAFLSLDVVGSTKMKQGEDPYVIDQAFADYRGLVERTLRRFGAYKQTWTPDGQMAAFRTAQSAVDCAKEILNSLPDFNRTVSKMRTDFQVRAGCNYGVVSTDDATPMEQMSDFTIDVAGHMQKYADPDSLWMAEAVYEQLLDKGGIEPNGQQVDNRNVYVWKRPD